MRQKAIVALTAILGALTGPVPLFGQDPVRSPAGESAATATVPDDSGGYDPAIPALETYRNWPPDEALERFYGHPWSRMAFRRAELFGRPVFFVLAVNWNRQSQRLAKETLTAPAVARMLNQGYVTVVVNADLHPDIRERYQTGAWPTMSFLLPDGNPVVSNANDEGQAKPITTSTQDEETLLFLLREGSVYWRKWPDLLTSLGARWRDSEGPDPPEPGAVDAAASEVMTRWLLGNADREEGGFGVAPKFLVPGLDEYAALREARALPALRRHSRLTLEQLVASPLFDRREGGIHRLAAGPSFTEIQYEKLLAVNAHLLRELTWSLRGSDARQLRAALRKTADFLTDGLGRPGGGFYLAQAADTRSEDGGEYWRQGGKGESPPVDTLVLSEPNATAGAALLRAGILLADEKMIDAGEAALDLVFERGYRSARGVRHVIEPPVERGVYLSTQAGVALAFLDAYETTGRRRYLDAARDIVDFATHNLKSAGKATYNDHLARPSPIGLLGNERRPIRANVRLARAMLRLAAHGAGELYREQAIGVLEWYAGDLSAFGVHGVEPALAIEEAIADPLVVRISGSPEDSTTTALRRAAAQSAWPWTIVQTGSSEGRPVAALTWRGESTEVGDAGALRREIAAFVGEEGS
jgi:uncharacterized protein YyaL (SSP411 family)